MAEVELLTEDNYSNPPFRNAYTSEAYDHVVRVPLTQEKAWNNQQLKLNQS